jgi:hypothetical protein
MIWVALAGPASNLLQAIVWMLLFVVYTDFGVTEICNREILNQNFEFLVFKFKFLF